MSEETPVPTPLYDQFEQEAKAEETARAERLAPLGAAQEVDFELPTPSPSTQTLREVFGLVASGMMPTFQGPNGPQPLGLHCAGFRKALLYAMLVADEELVKFRYTFPDEFFAVQFVKENQPERVASAIRDRMKSGGL